MTFSLGDFAAHLLTMEADIKAAEEVAIVRACKIVQRTAKNMIGHEQPYWPELKPETIARKAHGNTPLLETGELRRSIEYTAPLHEGGAVVGYVGSNNPKAVWHELGTVHIPPRPFLRLAAEGKEGEIVEMMGRVILGAMVNGGPNYRDARKVMHMLHATWEMFKDALPDDEDERD